jgi:predicted nucleotidyltransferase
MIARTGLSKRSVRQALQTLEATTVIEGIGSVRTRLYRARPGHPLAEALYRLFEEEERRFDAVLDAIRRAAESHPEMIATWAYGSVARGTDGAASDVDIAVVCEAGTATDLEQALRETLREGEERLAFTASVIAIDTGDLERLVRTNDPWWRGATETTLWLTGVSLDLLLRRLKRGQLENRRASE